MHDFSFLLAKAATSKNLGKVRWTESNMELKFFAPLRLFRCLLPHLISAIESYNHDHVTYTIDHY